MPGPRALDLSDKGYTAGQKPGRFIWRNAICIQRVTKKERLFMKQLSTITLPPLLSTTSLAACTVYNTSALTIPAASGMTR